MNNIIFETKRGCTFKCKVQPRSSRNAFGGILGDVIKVFLKSPPVDGKANKELVTFVAKSLKVSKSSVVIVSGETSRNKTILVYGVPVEELCKALAGMVKA
ncbi:MAG: YggU family protein [Lentisphaerae bacterium]|nr:YggU family protein [Lentisphaerota bacterium]MCP4101488.1 YggU family protein [Lentisphaerota bacterium]